MADAETGAAAERRVSPPGGSPFLRAFKVSGYPTFWFGSVLAFLAYQSWAPAQGVVAFDLTGNNSAVGLVVFGQGLSLTLLNPLSGAIADRVSKKLLVLGCQMIAFLTMGAVGFLIMADLISIPILAIAAFTIGTMFAFNGPSRNALIGDLVPRDQLGSAVALVQVGANFSRTAAPFMAGALLAWKPVGAAGTYLVMAAIMAAVIVTYTALPKSPERVSRHRTSISQDVRLGLRHVRKNPRLLQSVLSFHIVAMFGFSYIAIIPGFSKSVMDAGNAGVGLLLGAAAAGGVLSSLFAAGAAGGRHDGTILHASVFMLGAALVATGLAPSFLLAVLSMVFVGAGSSAFQTMNNVVALRHAHHDYYGRVMGFMFIAWGLTNLAGLPAGLTADWVGERTVLMGMGAVLCAFTALFIFWSRLIESDEARQRAQAAQPV